MLIYNIGFINSQGQYDETQLSIEERNDVQEEQIELINLILTLKDEMDIQQISYIDYVGNTEEDEI